MALDKATLKSTLITILSNTDSAKTVESVADAMATAIDTYVKTGTVNVTVSTAGGPTAQTGNGTGNIS